MVKFGVAGFPPAFFRSALGRNRLNICQWLRATGLDALELQMTFGPRTSEKSCREYRTAADDWDISLSVHASYFIVMTSSDREKLRNSTDTLQRTFELADILGANVVVLHPGSLYGVANGSEVQLRLVDNLTTALHQIGERAGDLFLETAGKLGQFGSVDEIVSTCRQLPKVFPCIDFGHVHARTGGSLHSHYGIHSLFRHLEMLGCFQPDQRVHFHYTPISYGPKGEIRHQKIDDRTASDGTHFHPRPEPIAAALRCWAPSCTLISETSDSQDQGALALKEAFDAMRTPEAP